MVYKNLLKKYVEDKNDTEILSLLIEIYKADRKCMKLMQQKEGQFTVVMQDVYRAYVADKAKIPENSNVFDLAIKLCVYEINNRKNLEKGITTNPNSLISGVDVTVNSPGAKPLPYIPGLSKQRRSFNPKIVTTPLTSALTNTSTTPSTTSSTMTSSKSTPSTTKVNPNLYGNSNLYSSIAQVLNLTHFAETNNSKLYKIPAQRCQRHDGVLQHVDGYGWHGPSFVERPFQSIRYAKSQFVVRYSTATI